MLRVLLSASALLAPASGLLATLELVDGDNISYEELARVELIRQAAKFARDNGTDGPMEEFAPPPAEQSRLQPGDQVEVRDGQDSPWKRGVVSSVDPVKVTPHGWSMAFRWIFARPRSLEDRAAHQIGQLLIGAPADASHQSPEGWPTEGGCYVRLASGCPNQPDLNLGTGWLRDAWGEEFVGARSNKQSCLHRYAAFSMWCGTVDVELRFHEDVGVPDEVGASPAGWLASPLRPEEPGCYVWMPSGCPRNPHFRAQSAWRRDEYAESERGAAFDQGACEARKAQFDHWCGARDAQMLFVVGPQPPRPTQPGCYVFHPTGCPRQQLKVQRQRWMHDAHGEQYLGARETRASCETTRRQAFDAWCGVDDTLMIWVGPDGVAPTAESQPVAQHALAYDSGGGPAPSASEIRPHVAAEADPAPPTEPGCYRRFPTGCSRRQLRGDPGAWVRDSYGEEHFWADTIETECKVRRKRQFDAWCGSNDARMLFVHAEVPAAPAAPGCYFYMPSGCPRRNVRRRQEWMQDQAGEERFGAKTDQGSCLRVRKAAFDRWCGTSDTMMTFVADSDLEPQQQESRRPTLPTEPGCYVWHKSGCRFGARRGRGSADEWVRDSHGEERLGARGSGSVCEIDRKRAFDKWCGVGDTEMLHVPPRAPPAPKEPGCYVWRPSGCPKQLLRPQLGWERDEVGEVQFGAKESGAICEVVRKHAFDNLCGTLDATMIFVGNVTQAAAKQDDARVARVTFNYVVAAGDPHMKSASGRVFDLRQPGEYPLVQIPRGGPPLLLLLGTIKSVGNPCSLFITQVSLRGSLFDESVVRVRAARHNPYEARHDQGELFGLQMAMGEPWLPLSNFSMDGEATIKSYQRDGWRVALRASHEPNAGIAASPGLGDDASTQGFFAISIKAPEATTGAIVKLHKRRFWINVNVGRLDNLGYQSVGGVLGTGDPDEAWTLPTKQCRRHEQESTLHRRDQLPLMQLGVSAEPDGAPLLLEELGPGSIMAEASL